MPDSKQKKITLPYCGIGFLIGFVLGCYLSYLGHPKAGVLLIPIFFFLGLLIDLGEFGWKIYWSFTQSCGFCGTRVSPMTRARVLSDDLKNGKYWFCSPKCYMEFHRRFYSERKQFNILSEGSPLIVRNKSD